MKTSKLIKVLLATLASLACVAFAIVAPSHAASKKTFGPTNVTADGNLADPTVLDYGDKFYAYGTQGPGGGGKIPIYSSNSASGKFHDTERNALPPFTDKDWAKKESAVFAPDVRHIGTVNGKPRFLLYYSAVRKGHLDKEKCIGVAVSSSPLGPFVPERQPLKCADAYGGIIDPSFAKVGNRNYVLFKTNHALNNRGHAERILWLMPLDASGTRRTGDPTWLHRADHNIENPQLMERNGKFLLMFSRDNYDTSYYKTVVRTSRSLKSGSFGDEKVITQTTNTGALGPGGADVIYVEKDNLGWVIFFHGWTPQRTGGHCGGQRQMYAATLDFAGDTPRLAHQAKGARMAKRQCGH